MFSSLRSIYSSYRGNLQGTEILKGDTIFTYLNMMCRYWIPGWHMLQLKTIPRMRRRQAFTPLPTLTYLQFQTLLESYFLLLPFCAGNSSLLDAYCGQMFGVQIPEAQSTAPLLEKWPSITHCLMLRKVVSNPFPSFVFTQKIFVGRYSACC